MKLGIQDGNVVYGNAVNVVKLSIWNVLKNKVMEAPEKIYLIRNISTSTSLNTTNDCHEKYLQEWYKGREKDTDIEYTRTDAFIEKAEKYLLEHLIDYWSQVVTDESDFIEGFKQFMKGE